MANETPRPTRVADGAAPSAPTAPHATPPAEGVETKRTGPQRFWDPWRVRVALVFALLASAGAHYGFGPWSLLPEEKLEFRDVDGELSIPVDVFEEKAPEPPAPAAPTATEGPGSATKPPTTAHGLDASVRDAEIADAEADAGGGKDGAPNDAEAEDAAGLVALADGAASTDAAAELASALDAGAPGSNGPRDPLGIVGAAGNVQAGPPLVQLLVNMEVIRKNPTGARMGPLLSGIPQWDEFMAGTHVDPVRDTDWVFIVGPSLIHTDRDAILIHYSASDAVVDKAVDVVAHKYWQGGAFDAGVPGVKASLGHADRAPRVFVRPQPHVLAVVPPDYANTAAKMLQHARIQPHVRPGEAMRLTLATPHRPMPFIPESVSELRLWIVPRASDGGADVFAEGDTPDPAAAQAAANEMARVVRTQNSIGVRIVTQGLLNGVEFSADGKTVRGKMPVTHEQLEAVLNLVAAQLGVALPPPPPSPGSAPR